MNANPVWFSNETTDFWDSTVYWNTLTPVRDGWLFISQERDYANGKAYSIRHVVADGTIDTLSFQQTSNRDEANALLNQFSFELGSDFGN
jgi:hypothetical protein